MVSFRRVDDTAEARAIVQAMRALQGNPTLVNEARSDLPGALERLGLSETARHALAATLALGVCGVAAIPATPVFWATG